MPTAGNDTITGTPGNDTINGLAGDDSINGAAGSDSLNGNIGNDTLVGDDGADTLFGDIGDDSIRGGIGNDWLLGGGGNDTILGDAGDDTISTSDEGVAHLFGGAGSDSYIINFIGTLNGKIDNIYDFVFDEDALVFSGSGYSITQGISIDGAGSNNDIRIVYGSRTINLLNPVLPVARIGTAGVDNLRGTIVADTLDGLGGADNLNGGGGPDLLIGGDGDDQLYDNEGFSNDPIGNDTLTGRAGNDTLFDGHGDDFLDGGDGDDSIVVGAGNDLVSSGSGRDLIVSTVTGLDTITDYDPVNDVLDLWTTGLRGFLGLDLDGDGASDDALVGYVAYAGSSLTILNYGNPAWQGGAGAETRLGLPFSESMFGGDGADSLFGRAGDDSLYGEAGNDFLNGGEGNDLVDGGSGNDLIIGGDRDTLIGGSGDDTLNFGTAGPIRATGGNGSDVFVVSTAWPQTIGDHVITDFNFSEDQFDFDEVGTIQFGLDLDGDLQSDDAKVIYGNKLISLLDVAAPGRVVRSGTSASERIAGSIIDDLVDAGAGADTVTGGSGNDSLFGQDGSDTISGGSGSDTLFGGAGDDTLGGMDGNDVIDDGAGNDLIQEFLGNDTIYLGAGFDTIHAGDTIWRLTVHGFNSAEDRLSAAPGSLVANGMQDLDGDGAADDLRLVFSGGATIDLMSAQIVTMFLSSSAFSASGNPFNDTIVGAGNSQWIEGLVGDDSLFGGGGFDSLYGQSGNDSLFGQADADSLLGGIGNDYLSGGDGNDVLVNESGSDTILGDAGDDRFDQTFSGAFAEAGDVDIILGGDGNDIINTSVSWEYVDGEAGNDRIVASTSISAFGLDALHGGAGMDTLSFENFSSGTLTVNVAWGLYQGATGALGTFSGFERLQFGWARDIVVGWTGNPTIDLSQGDDWFADFSPGHAPSHDSVFGSFGNDALYGLSGDDSLDGGDGDDFVIGGDGNDTLEGGLGADWMSGGAGSDVFVFRSSLAWPFPVPIPPPMPTNGFDVAAQFQPGVDKIDLRLLDGNPNVAGYQPLTIGDFALGTPGRLRWSSPAGQTYTVVEADLNGDAVRDFVFIVYGETNGQITQVQLTAGDFIL